MAYRKTEKTPSEEIPMPELVKQIFVRSGLTVDEFERRVADILNDAFKSSSDHGLS